MRILNLYAGIGGNRKLWGGEHTVVAVEIDPDIAKIYADLFPDDAVIVGDAHQYLLDHFQEFDFIWSSPPCQTHGSFRQNIGVRYRGVKPAYPDMKLYEEILFLMNNAPEDCHWVVENVKPYYEPLVRPTVILQRHYFWANFGIMKADFEKENLRAVQIPQLQKLHDVDLSGYKLKNKRQVLRNCVGYELGAYILSESESRMAYPKTIVKQRALL